jgi:hypothetical protein
MELQDEVIKCIKDIVCETHSNISITDSLISSRSITVRGSPGTLIPDTSAVKLKVSQSTNSMICGPWYVYLIPLVLTWYGWLHSACQDHRCCPYSRCSHGYSLVSALPLVSPDNYLVLCAQQSSRSLAPTHKRKISTLLWELSDNADTDLVAVPEDPSCTWMWDFRAYLNVFKHVPEGWTTIEWWGVSHFLFNLQCSLDNKPG